MQTSLKLQLVTRVQAACSRKGLHVTLAQSKDNGCSAKLRMCAQMTPTDNGYALMSSISVTVTDSRFVIQKKRFSMYDGSCSAPQCCVEIVAMIGYEMGKEKKKRQSATEE